MFTIESAAQFAKVLKQYDEYYCFILNITYIAVYGGVKVAKVNQRSKQMVVELEKKNIQLCLVSLHIPYGSKDNYSRFKDLLGLSYML